MFNKMNNNIEMLNKALDGYWLRNKAINQNISNVNTPNYKKLTVSFEDELRDAMNTGQQKLTKTHNKHLPISRQINGVEPKINTEKTHSYRFDKNNVNIDTESADLAKNNIMYNALINQTIGEFEKIKNVIVEGSK